MYANQVLDDPAPALDFPYANHTDRAECASELAHLGGSGLSSDERPADTEEDDDGTVWITCTTCHGIGARDGLVIPMRCGTCDGGGEVPVSTLNLHD